MQYKEFNENKELKLIKEITLRILKEINLDKENEIFGGKEKITTLDGIPSLLILLGELSKIDNEFDWDKYSFYLFTKLNDELNNSRFNASVHYGLSGIGYSILANYKNGTRYNKFLNIINKKIITVVNNNISNLKPCMENVECISGLSGIGRYLLFFKDDKDILETIKNILVYINKFLDDIEFEGKKIPGWYSDLKDSEKYKFNNTKYGCFNLGLSHGVSGCLAFLSIALINEVEVKNHKENINKILDFMYKFRMEKNGNYYFPSVVSLENYMEDNKDNPYHPLPTWCYGISGVARSIYLAGKAIDNNFYITDSIKLIMSTRNKFNNSIDDLGFISPTFCHGYSGYMQVLNLFYKDTKIEEFKEMSDLCKNKVLNFYDKNNIFGFSDYDRAQGTPEVILKKDSLGMLTGTTSVLLTILESNTLNISEWNGIMLIN